MPPEPSMPTTLASSRANSRVLAHEDVLRVQRAMAQPAAAAFLHQGAEFSGARRIDAVFDHHHHMAIGGRFIGLGCLELVGRCQVFHHAVAGHQAIDQSHGQHTAGRGQRYADVHAGECRHLTPDGRADSAGAHERNLEHGHAACAYPVGQAHLRRDAQCVGGGQPGQAGQEHGRCGHPDLIR